ncbi:hypothetical protein [Enterococcus sp. AZ126]|uniref:hypothetical protein n=1 Tax=Enterococcus sp. AZ126 TaxID=2774635 RepID=UPI003F25D7BE
MKYVQLLGIAALTTIVFGGIAATSASAETVVGQTKETPATVTIQDSDDTEETDPLDPTDPDQKLLTLEAVPAAYNFETVVQNKAYAVNGTLTDQNVSVFNDRSTRKWSVKATVKDNHIVRGTDTFAVTDFKVNNAVLVGTGATGIVAKSNATPTAANNTGQIDTPVTTTSIGFTDQNNVLKAGDVLTGTISYQLYNTVTAN